MNRIQNKIDRNKSKIVQLLNETIDLEYEKKLKRFHRTYDDTKQIGTKRKPDEIKVKIGVWYEWFKDEDQPDSKGIKVERNEIIEVDGKKSNHWKIIEYYKLEDI